MMLATVLHGPGDVRYERDAGGCDVATVAMLGDFGTPRPALVIQFDRFAGTGRVTVLP